MDNSEVKKEEQNPEEPKQELDTLEKRTRNFKNWLKNPLNSVLLALIAFTIIIRIYYFVITYNQPLWWDEATYMVIAKNWIANTPQVLDPVRQYLFPWMLYIFIKIANNEFLPRLLLWVLSFASVIGTYFLGKELYNKKIGLFAGFLISVFYLNIFFSYRLLVDIPSLAFFTFSAYFFYKYLKSNSVKSLYIAAIVAGIGTMFKLTTAYILFIVLIYLLVTNRFQFLKKKEIWISAVIYIVVISPYIIWGYFQFHGFVLAQSAASVAPPNLISIGWSNFTTYLSMFPVYIFNAAQGAGFLLILAALALIALLIYYFYKLFLGFDILVKTEDRDKNLTRDFYVLLLLVVPLILVSLMINHYEDRYILNIFPAFFIIIGVFVFNIYDFLKSKKLKVFGFILLILIIIFFAYAQLSAGDSLIKAKLTSYGEVRDVGLWMKQNTNSSDTLLSSSGWQIQYYSDRLTYFFPATAQELTQLIQEKHPKYFMISVFEGNPDYVDEKSPDNAKKSYQVVNNFKLVRAYYMDQQQTQWFIKVYEIPENFNPGVKIVPVNPVTPSINSTKTKVNSTS